MKKQDKEFGRPTEFAPLPDEYLQGGGKNAEPVRKKKKRLFLVAAAILVCIVAFSTPTKLPENTVIEKPEDPKTEQPKNDPSNGKTDNSENGISVSPLPVYPLEDTTDYYTVYLDIFDPAEPDGIKRGEGGFVFEQQLLMGLSQPLEEPPAADGYIFTGWVMLYSGGRTGLIKEINSENVSYVKPEDGGRNIEIHASWRSENKDGGLRLLLDANGGNIDGKQSAGYNAEGPMMSGTYVYLCSYPVPERDGYTFAGWYEDAACTKKAKEVIHGTAFYEKTGNEPDFTRPKEIKLYAGWAKN